MPAVAPAQRGENNFNSSGINTSHRSMSVALSPREQAAVSSGTMTRTGAGNQRVLRWQREQATAGMPARVAISPRVRRPVTSTGLVVLGQMAARLPTIDVACNRCDRRGRLHTAPLVAVHGAAMPVLLLLRTIAADCARMQAAQVHDVCGVHQPQLSWVRLVHLMQPDGRQNRHLSVRPTIKRRVQRRSWVAIR